VAGCFSHRQLRERDPGFQGISKNSGFAQRPRIKRLDDLDEARIFGDALKLRTVVYILLPGRSSKSCAAGNAAASSNARGNYTRREKFSEEGFYMLKHHWILLCALELVMNQAWATDTTTLKNDKNKLSYSIGASIGKNLKNESTDVDLGLLIEGLKTSFAGEKVLLSDKEIHQVMNDYQMQLRQRATLNKQQATSENKKKGEAYLAGFKAQQGVQALPSGVLYKIIKTGDGKKPLESDMVEVNYRGTKINGSEFDATESGHPASLKASALIAGWKQALSMMPVGSKWQIVIPSQLAYGERGIGSDIGPNEVLIFDVELVAIK
jgi:FKBP-type peptidyl-prolyl cis-trans isomerase FklB